MSSVFGNLGSSTQQQPNPFASTQKPNPFGLTIGTSSAPQQSSSLFGSTHPQQLQQQQGGGLFGSTSQSQGSSLFGSTAQPQQQQGGSLFGSTTQPQQQQGGGLFGNLGNTQSQHQQQQGGGLFGTGGTQSQQQQGGGLFGNLGTQAQAPQEQSIFGQSNNNNQQQPQQQQQQQAPQLISQQSRIWTEQDIRQKSVISQIETIYSKWNSESANSSFHTYLYNTFPPDAVPFFRPDPSDNEEKWEEALRKRPNPGAIPFIVKGFWQLGQRILIQEEHLRVLHGRLYEINNGLTDLLNKHDVDITTRAAECRRKHLVLSQKCLALATKTQVLRNRGYALDTAEEELKQKLTMLEKKVFDPALSGRSEEIWARMVSVRERGRQLQYEVEKHGLSLQNESEQSLDEETLRKAKKILEDYNSQMAHLAKELEQIRKDFDEWEQSGIISNGYR